MSPTDPVEALRQSYRAGHPIEGYRLENVLGRGGQGVVFAGRRESTGAAVAIKVMPAGVAELEGDRCRWLAELQHPHLVALLDRGAEGPIGWVVFAHGGDRTFADLLRQPVEDRHLGPRLLAGIAEALHCLHRHGVTHRDVKPANILVRGEHARLADFGLLAADPASGGPGGGLPAGTPAFAAPETVGGAEPGPPADVYGIGRCLEEWEETLTRRSLPRLPGATEWVARCTARLPADRPSAGLLAEGLRAMGRGQPSGGRGPGTMPALAPRTPRWRPVTPRPAPRPVRFLRSDPL